MPGDQIAQCCGAEFFALLDDVMWGDMLLHIARLTDLPRTAQRETLSITQLPPLVHPSIRDKVRGLVKGVESKAKFARDWRHRKLAHTDLSLALGMAHAKPLAASSRAAIKDVLHGIGETLNAVESHYLQSEVWYEMSGDSASGLLYRLRDGLEAETERRERLKSGRWRPEDLGPRPL
jgi:hypothetical protein